MFCRGRHMWCLLLSSVPCGQSIQSNPKHDPNRRNCSTPPRNGVALASRCLSKRTQVPLSQRSLVNANLAFCPVSPAGRRRSLVLSPRCLAPLPGWSKQVDAQLRGILRTSYFPAR